MLIVYGTPSVRPLRVRVQGKVGLTAYGGSKPPPYAFLVLWIQMARLTGIAALPHIIAKSPAMKQSQVGRNGVFVLGGL